MENEQNNIISENEPTETVIGYPDNLVWAIFGCPFKDEPALSVTPEFLTELDEILNTIPEKERTALIMYFRQRKSIAEIAIALKTKPYYANHRYIGRGIRMLRHPSRAKRIKPYLPKIEYT